MNKKIDFIQNKDKIFACQWMFELENLHSKLFPFSSHCPETQGAAAYPALLPPAKLLPDEKDPQVHQEDSPGDRQVSDSFPLTDLHPYTGFASTQYDGLNSGWSLEHAPQP